ncbi:MAG TPA: hypothetical protein PKN86_15950 [Candidatus Obscuribacter sp.]|nr:hypothetical protein [Candidatus Obscuribacter sp.]HMW88783.1 hypothetical protein [Candidatus Obscuribacter sp.]HMY56566.1 hypothetical protein [Candidatus Obscuribacter sp.]HNB15809.1 hypothetical protein [Candidatus Obscuribacter sp.]HND70138.1 hypothetical protein [Candidatus Obscuribacter sp.]
MTTVNRPFSCGLASPVPVFSLVSAFVLAFPPSMQAQDAFGSGPSAGMENVVEFEVADYGDYTVVTGRNGGLPGEPPLLEGCTNGTIAEQDDTVHLPRDEYKKLVVMPDGREMLGLSLCDLTCREVAAEEELPPADFPIMPRTIALPPGMKMSGLPRPAGDEYAFWPRSCYGWNLGEYVDRGREHALAGVSVPVSGSDDVVITRKLLDEIMRVNELAAGNPDYSCRIAALGLKYFSHCRVKESQEIARDQLDLESNREVVLLKRVLRFKESIARIKASDAPASKREMLAARLEKEGKLYDALVERLRVEEMQDNGVARYHLAMLYRRLGERKLAFEKLKEAVESTWAQTDRALLTRANVALGDSLMDASTAALRQGAEPLSLARLRNASAAYRRACVLSPRDQAAVTGLLRCCKQAAAIHPCFDNSLMLAGAYCLSGDFGRAQGLYDACAEINADDPRLRKARLVAQQCQRRSGSAG